MPALTKEQNPIIGRRVKLVRCGDPYTELLPGAIGTVRLVDDMDTVHVDWDCGSRLGLCEDAGDVYHLLDEVKP